MSIRNLDYLFKPKSVAVIGASNKPRSVGATVMLNLLEGGFSGPLMPVNPKYEAVAGVLAYPDVASLPRAPELAVICTPAKIVPGLINELGERGTKAAVVLTAGLTHLKDEQGRTLQEAMLEAARPHLMRVLGPNCVGLIVPGLGLNASFAHTSAAPGKIAFVSQSGGLTTGVLDWARSKGIGFSYFISLGDSADVDFGDVLDFLASEANTGAILLYIESIKATRKFMSAARAAARNKPVLAVKAGRAPEGAKAAASHTGALAGSDDVYDAAIRRAGMLRVLSIEDLFDAVETLARSRPIKGDRLTIVTNGGGPGVMATDALVLNGGRLASLSEETISKLDEVLPPTWSRGNPVDIIGDAPVERYVETLKIVLQDPQSDAVMIVHVPTDIVSSTDISTAVSPVSKQAGSNVKGCWLGSNAEARARELLSEAGVTS
jgi:acetyltransferase